MLVEDDKSLREIYGVRLLAEGYEIISAGDGEEALAMAVKEHPDLILSDVMMPKISGFDMLDILKATPETKEIKVIMMTALSSEDQRARGESLGANRYLVKSQVGIEDVVRTVHDVLSDVPEAKKPSTSEQTFEAPKPTAQQQNPTPVSQPSMPVQDNEMPQPTAPFSSPAPASLGDQIMNPIQQDIPASTTIPVTNTPAPQPIAEPVTTPAPQPTIAPIQNQQPSPLNPYDNTAQAQYAPNPS
ncbi:MAG: hypothetical protein PWQ10_680, partial [Patescibacteria group bacterium]|nr:hypothetical protein [Patescibacteria group bacterium]